jgi:hypothetical protein
MLNTEASSRLMSNRLPTSGGDNGDWGNILNSYLEVSLASDGTLNSNTVGTAIILHPAHGWYGSVGHFTAVLAR